MEKLIDLKLEVFDNIISEYSDKSKRAYEKGNCLYRTSDRKCCAVGMYLSESAHTYISNRLVAGNYDPTAVNLFKDLTEKDIMIFSDNKIVGLKDEYRFWEEMQNYHDNVLLRDEESRENFILRIKEEIKEEQI